MATSTHGSRSTTFKYNETNVAPTVNDDGTASYVVGSRWWDTTADKEYVCLDTTTGAAVWRLTSGRITPTPLMSYIDKKERLTNTNVHGDLLLLSAGDALDAVPTNIVVTSGIGKIMVAVNAGGDLAGDITVTGTTVDRDSGAETGADTDTLTVDALTTDASDADAIGNTRYAFTGAYITSKWFKGSVTLSTANLTLTDVDTYNVTFEQVNDAGSYTIDTFDVNALATDDAAWLYAYLYSLVVTGDKCNIVREASLELPAADVTQDRYYRLRKGNIGQVMSGATDGLWVNMFLGPLANTHWSDITSKVWVLTDNTGGPGPVELHSKDVSIADPGSAENITFFYTPVALTATELRVIVVGGASVTLIVKHDTDRSAGGTNLYDSQTYNSTTTGETAAAVDTLAIPAASYVWITTSAVAGAPSDISVHLRYTVD